ncbi:hypothetical protein E4U13_000658 [Claviceps humidiphila]|uniref:Centrosomin N-terminal motif 1 domain-containing protein n=1 Tax=Claviceps humidiphila TaxID=1294629 RepID=A0A9P7Q7S2_9HYPO|nr:hypothetical protein E4U13_000658 [Claviceps humidiphila]
MSRPTSSPPRRDSIDSSSVSTFLQEKLERERKVELEKQTQLQSSLSRLSPDMNAPAELGRALGSPLKASSSVGNRPASSAGYENVRKKGHGVKEMEQVISTLHKQNFDLKLELYHRRERQNTLEARLDSLESDKARMEDVNDRLLIELEKRDKAVEEAVAMIINLETKVDRLLRERSMVQQMGNEKFLCAHDYNDGYVTPVTRSRAGSDSTRKKEGTAKAVNRMPSFVSDYSETTENLRNVYLNGKGSVLSLSRVADSSPGTENMRAMGSPTPSVLSESSFVSVYGRKERVGMSHDDTNMDETLVAIGPDAPFFRNPGAEKVEQCSGRCGTARSISSSRTAGSRTSSAGHFQSITDVIGGSPLQRLERSVTASYSSRRDSGHRRAHGAQDNTTVQSVSQDGQSGQGGTRQNKRNSLRKVLTDGSGSARLHDHGLPPTPDTMSSSTLRRLQGSDDSLLREWALALRKGAQAEAERESWASPSRSNMDSLSDKGGDASASRQRSAAHLTITTTTATTPSHKNGQDGWDSDKENDSDTLSLHSSLDIWMREGALSPRTVERGSQDAYSLRSTGSRARRATGSIINGLESVSEDGTHTPSPTLDCVRDLFSLRQGLFTNTAPPPPNRRSSLLAGTGSSETASQPSASQASDCASISETGSSSTKHRSHRSRKNSADVGRREDSRTPVPRDQQAIPPVASRPTSQSQPSSDHKQRSHAPVPAQQHGARAGLNRLFRRSMGGASPAAPTKANTPEPDSPATIKDHHLQHHAAMGVPSRASQSPATEDDRSGATPPPISLNPRQARRNTVGAEGEAERLWGEEVHKRSKTSVTSGPSVAATAAAVALAQREAAVVAEESPSSGSGAGAGAGSGAGVGTRRKWLVGFSRREGKSKGG